VAVRIAIVLSLLACVADAAAVERLRGRVVAVIDGHTLTVLLGARRAQVHLAYVEAPVSVERHAIRSRQSLIAVCGGEPVELEVHRKQADGSFVASASCNGNDAAAEQVQRGMAALDTRYGVADAHLLALQREAQSARRGLWANARAAAGNRGSR
jgi:endonuclease YncB( thermonuclease family)